MAKMTVYHGGFVPVPIPEIRIGRNTKDFGNGFYCTVIKEQAQRWARRYRTKIDCRSGKPLSYDIVIGAMANDQIYNYISDYIDGIITREQFWVLAKFKYPTHQINFCTPEALQCLEYRGYEEVD